jgi:hypothetical protein
MSTENQAEADIADQTTALDPLDAGDSTNSGTNPMSAYEAELAKAIVEDESEADEYGEQPTDGQESEDEQSEQTASQDDAEEEQEESPDESGDEGDVKIKDRFRFKDSTDQAIAAIAKAKGISLVDAVKIFEGQTPTKAEEETIHDVEVTDTVVSVTAEIKDLQAKKREMLAALEFESAAEIDEQLEDLRDKRDELKISEVKAKTIAEQRESDKFYADFAESERQTIKFYPDAAKADSAIAKEMKRLDAEMQAIGDPIYYTATKPFVLAKEAAKNLGIPMKNPSKPVIEKTATNRPMQPASGNARTTTTAPSVRQEEAIDRIGSIVDYEKFVEGLR